MTTNELENLEELRLILTSKMQKNIYIFGTGYWGNVSYFAANAIGVNIKAYIDNDINKIGQKFNNKKIISAESLSENRDNSYILIGVRERHYEIEKQLIEMGFVQNQDFICAVDYLGDMWCDINQEIDTQTSCLSYTPEEFKNVFCPVPFTRLSLLEPSWSLCCGAYYNYKPERLTVDNIDKVWNSKESQKMRAAVLDGSYKYCKKDLCPYITTRSLLPKDEAIKNALFKDIIENQKTELDNSPLMFHVSIDTSCNLKCRMCRGTHIFEANENSDELMTYLENGRFEGVRYIILAGDGEVFFSQVYKRFLEIIDDAHFPDLKYICILSNGTLFNEYNWEKISERFKKYTILVSISVDAYYENTYKRIRRGGDYKTLRENLKFISGLKKQGRVSFIRYSFCVQRENFREMPKFLDLCEENNVDLVCFQRLRLRPDYEFVHQSNNIYYDEFCEILQDERMKTEMVDISQFKYYVDVQGDQEKIWKYNNTEFIWQNGLE